jgi:sortase A
MLAFGVAALCAMFSVNAQAQTWKVQVFDRDESHDVPDLQEGDVVGRLEIPRLGISVMVLQGTGEATLIAGVGHVPGTPTPGGDGNVVIAAHRDSFFRRLEGIQAGDRIRIATGRGVYEYVVESTSVVDPGDTQVMESRGRQELTLITRYPFSFDGATPTRFVVHARLLTATARDL